MCLSKNSSNGIAIPKIVSKGLKFFSPHPKYVNPTHGLLYISIVEAGETNRA
jgi:hypothetical protein